MASEEPAAKRAKTGQESHYKVIDGVKYERDLLEAAEGFAADGQIGYPEAKQLWKHAEDSGSGVTDVQRATLKYALNTYKFSAKAETFLTTYLYIGTHTSYYKVEDGVRYHRALLESFQKAAADGQVSFPEAKKLLEEASDGKGVTETERATMEHALRTLKFTAPAQRFLETKLRQLEKPEAISPSGDGGQDVEMEAPGAVEIEAPGAGATSGRETAAAASSSPSGDGGVAQRQAEAEAPDPNLGAPLPGAGVPAAPPAPPRPELIAKSPEVPALVLFLMGWALHYFALPADERPCAFGCTLFEFAAFLGVLWQVVVAISSFGACLVVCWAHREPEILLGTRATTVTLLVVFAVGWFLSVCLPHRLMPEHLAPFWGSIGAALAAPQRVASALSDGGLRGLDAAGRDGAWRPMLWGCLWYEMVIKLFILLVYGWRVIAEHLRQEELMGLQMWQICLLGGLVAFNIIVLMFPVMTWLQVLPLVQPVWLYLHSCVWSLGSYLSSPERGPAPKPDQLLGLVLLVWFLLARAAAFVMFVPAWLPAPECLDEKAVLKRVMDKGVFRAKMEERGLSLRSLTKVPLLRKLSSRLSAEAKDVESKREKLKSGSIASHGGEVSEWYIMGPVVRKDLLESSLRLLRTASVGQLLSSSFEVRFAREDGVDAGGVTRDWFDGVARELARGSEEHERKNFEDVFSSSLLACAPDGTLLPRPSGRAYADCEEAPGELRERWAQLFAVGRFLGVAVLECHPLPLSFGQVLMKLLCEGDVSYDDVRHLDNDFYRHRIVNILEEGGVERASAALMEPLTFISAPTGLMPEQVPLKDNGDQIHVTEENKMEYIGLLSEARICNGRRHELQFFICGFHEVIPVDVLREANVSPAELSLLISGAHEYDVKEWRTHAKETGNEKVLSWFWEVVASLTEEQRALLLHFSTGSSRIPPGGFKFMKPLFQVHITGESEDRVPTSHTCFNQLCIPMYRSKALLHGKLLLAISTNAGFGFA